MPISASEFEFISGLVRQRSAIVLESGKEYLAEQRLTALARREGFASLSDLLTKLRCQPANTNGPANKLDRQVVEAMTTNETFFFRDVAPFEALRQAILPTLAAKKSGPLHIWSAACSSGQEPYTIAMLLQRDFPALVDTKILATDLSREVLDKARQGRYTQLEVSRGLPAPLLVRHFKRDGLHWQLDPAIIKMVEFRELNLIEAWPRMPMFDVVFLRNVLIYFSVETKRAILRSVRSVLKPGGYLFLGGAETTLNLDEAFTRVPFEKSSFYRLAGG